VHINAVQNAISILQNDAHAAAWAYALKQLASQDNVHGLVRGRACRLIFDRSEADDETATLMSQALSPGTPATQSAAWVQGFLHEGGQALIHHPHLWHMVDAWVQSLPEELFTTTLPLLRRTFSTFPAPERHQLGEMAKTGGNISSVTGVVELDAVRVEKALELVKLILNERRQ
jgi:hypothetical protein